MTTLYVPEDIKLEIREIKNFIEQNTIDLNPYLMINL